MAVFKTTEALALDAERRAEHATTQEERDLWLTRAQVWWTAEAPARYATVRASSQREVEQYLPGNYAVIFAATGTPDGRQDFVIAGADCCGWTLDGYVLPRLASGLITGREHRSRDDAFGSASAAMN